ncbi:DUF3658 domain-containing protein [Asticcacaulis endophyticus]|uniref:DUF3658 domain-containing protein n=1 Tax=Asticcacaulis endophyticus TaxID=1395890 RepID=A0A918PYA4_9CAUL|nr:DUF3658 domain-containing protein [Asticcacaulis endophyticus]GGZ27374.1 hypothetical protein GCM10011273_11330 [Asticcacaulis endophyticus]
MADRRTLHIVFSLSAPVHLRRALQTVDKDEDVIGLGADWSFGPLADAEVRKAYVEPALGYVDEEWDDQIKSFWERSLKFDGRRVVWFSRRQPREYCNFLEWLRLNGDQTFEVIDLSDSYITTLKGQRFLVGSVSRVGDNEFVSEAFWDHARLPALSELRAWRSLWETLREENAPIRVVTINGLVSRELDCFDDELLSYIKGRWIKAYRVVGNVMADMLRNVGVIQTSDLVLRFRLQELLDAGTIETKGVSNISARTWLRRPRHHTQ